MNGPNYEINFLMYFDKYRKHCDTYVIRSSIEFISHYFQKLNIIGCSLVEVDDVRVVEQMIKIAEQDDSFYDNILEIYSLTHHKTLNMYYHFLLKETCTPSEIVRLTMFGDYFYFDDYENYEGYVPVIFTYDHQNYYRLFSWRPLYITMMRLLHGELISVFENYIKTYMTDSQSFDFVQQKDKHLLRKPIHLFDDIYMETDFTDMAIIKRICTITQDLNINTNNLVISVTKPN